MINTTTGWMTDGQFLFAGLLLMTGIWAGGYAALKALYRHLLRRRSDRSARIEATIRRHPAGSRI